MINSFEEIARNDPVLVFGAGGGGDVIGAFHVYNKLKTMGAETYLGALVWERYVVDPHPGPIPLIAFIDIDPISETAAMADDKSRAYRYGREIIPQVIRVANAINERVVILDGSRGGEGLALGLASAVDYLNAKTVIGVDVGGDILAKGWEESLWSPLADSLSLYAIHRVKGEKIITIHGAGADGELPEKLVYNYISEIARKGGLITAIGLDRNDINLFNLINDHVITEASKIPIEAFKGYNGRIVIRNGTREVNVNPCTAITFLLDAEVTYNHSEIAKLVAGSRHIGEASRKLNERCIYTEYDLEKDIASLLETGMKLDDIDITKVRSEGLTRLKHSCQFSMS
ncbi:MAG: DUF1152 domain-containing protein [Desulfurococcales archaeon]|nr:DUF1152 domain-containing protein [Desulfurococcales archaeon]